MTGDRPWPACSNPFHSPKSESPTRPGNLWPKRTTSSIHLGLSGGTDQVVRCTWDTSDDRGRWKCWSSAVGPRECSYPHPEKWEHRLTAWLDGFTGPQIQSSLHWPSGCQVSDAYGASGGAGRLPLLSLRTRVKIMRVGPLRLGYSQMLNAPLLSP